MLGLMLQAHPRIAIPPENRFFLPAYFERETYGDLDQPENRRLLADKIVRTKGGQFKDLGLDPGKITERIVTSGCTIGSALGLVLRAYADRFGKTRWGDKRPGYHSYISMIQRMFPDAQFVHIVRDGRDAVASMKFGPSWDRSISTYRRVVAWMEAIEHTREAQRTLRSDSYYELQYEKLVTEPEKELRQLVDFVGEPFDDAMLNPQSVAGQVVPEHKTHHARTHEPVSTSSIGRFHERLELWELQLCEAVMGERLQEFGYELTGAAAPADEHLINYRTADQKRRSFLDKERNKDLAVRDIQPVVDMALADQVTELQRQVNALAKDRDIAQAKLEKVLGSRTWRWTNPARTVVRTVNRRKH